MGDRGGGAVGCAAPGGQWRSLSHQWPVVSTSVVALLAVLPLVAPEVWSGFAFGFGIDRLAQVLHTIPDMRQMADNDLRILTQF